MQSEATKGTYHGTFPIRVIGKSGEQGIHMPQGRTGDFAIWEDDEGNFSLRKVGERGKKVKA